MDIQVADLVNPDTNPLPEETQHLVAALLEGRVASMFLIAEVINEEGLSEWIEGYEIDMDDNESDEMGFVGRVGLAHLALQQDLLGHEIHVHIGGDEEEDDDADE